MRAPVWTLAERQHRIIIGKCVDIIKLHTPFKWPAGSCFDFQSIRRGNTHATDHAEIEFGGKDSDGGRQQKKFAKEI